ncbi:P-loop containing nucleoside triphosphate hydrolase protein [Trametes meyenii]|nr:P-loop containing nucleoside triphosphate hydrolase protein [Trametes meyenii]
MAASLWTKSLAFAPAARICRCLPSAARISFRAGRLSSVRYASAAVGKQQRQDPGAALHRPEDHQRTHPREAHSHPGVKEGGSDSPAKPHQDQPKFETLKGSIDDRLLRALTREPFRLTHMSPVQAAVVPLIPNLLEPHDPEKEAAGPRDLLVKARTGTGKTLGFLLPAVEARLRRLQEVEEQMRKDIDSSRKSVLVQAVDRFARQNVGAVILSPTRELATQIANEAIKLTHHIDRFEVRLVVGGLPKRSQLREWHTGRRDILVATPGRLRDFIENESGFADDLKTADTFILDEADTLLDMGFREDIQAITEHLKPSPERQTFMFSATVSTAIQQVARKTLARNHQFINCVPDDAPPTHLSIPQYYTAVPSPKEQLPHILRLIAEDQLANPGKSKVLVFAPTTALTRLYSTILQEIGRDVLPTGSRTRFGELHSKKSMSGRISQSNWFRNETTGASVMVTSDVSARGVDYPGVTRVIQIGIPATSDIYVHRVGRTGRGASMSGRADLVLMPWELGFLTWQLTDIPIKELTTNQLKEQLATLAATHDEHGSPSAGPRSPLLNRVLPRLENMDNAFAHLHEVLSPEDVREAMVTVLAFYTANHDQLRVDKNVTAAGVHEWAAALLGKEVDLRLPRDFLGSSRGRPTRSGRRDHDRNSGFRSHDRNDRTFSRRRRDDDDGGYGSFSRRRDDDDGGYRSFPRRRDDESGSFRRRDDDRSSRRPRSDNDWRSSPSSWQER